MALTDRVQAARAARSPGAGDKMAANRAIADAPGRVADPAWRKFSGRVGRTAYRRRRSASSRLPAWSFFNVEATWERTVAGEM